jgi:predicted O-methyltransferase YrrM
MLDALLKRARKDSAFAAIRRRFDEAKVESWIQEEEKALHFGVGAYAPGGGSIIEIGSHHGGSACFLAAGLARRRKGRLTCIDPHLGAPLWLGTAPAQHTLDIFRSKTRACGVSDWIDLRVGESTAVAATWPAEPIDAVFIDGDHSFLGALKDFECWGPKLRPGGILLIDDADDPSASGLRDMIALIKSLSSIRELGVVQGIAVFERTKMPVRAMLDELSRACAARRIIRPWDLAPLHGRPLPTNYASSQTWNNGALDELYLLGFLSRCGAAAYGYSPGSCQTIRPVLQALSRDRADGEFVELPELINPDRDILRQSTARFRVLLVTPEEAEIYAPLLLPGGLAMARLPGRHDPQVAARGQEQFARAGLIGNDVLHGDLLYGVWQPHSMAVEGILEKMAADAA